MKRLLAVSLLLLGGCQTLPPVSEQPADREQVPASEVQPEEPVVPAVDPRFEPAPGRDAAFVAEMRAAPAPENPEVEMGGSRSADRARLAARGLVAIGSARLAGPEAIVRADAERIGREVGAEVVRIHVPADESTDWLATYHVRFQLPFGATFRDLRADERAEFQEGGVQLGTIIGNTPASRANLLEGDYVLYMNGIRIANRAAFQARLRENAGRTVTLTIVRNGIRLERSLRLGVLPDGG